MNPNMKAFVNDEDKVEVVLTGHKNGSIYVWHNDELRGEMCRYKGEILCITSFDLGIIIITDSSYLYLVIIPTQENLYYDFQWDFELKNCVMEVDLCSLKTKLNSLKVATIVTYQNKAYIATVEGDVVEIVFSFKKEPFKNYAKYSFKVV